MTNKLHKTTDIDFGLIREVETTTATVHDSQNRPHKTGRSRLSLPWIFRCALAKDITPP